MVIPTTPRLKLPISIYKPEKIAWFPKKEEITLKRAGQNKIVLSAPKKNKDSW